MSKFKEVYDEGGAHIGQLKSLGATTDPKREAGRSKPSLQNISPVALYLEAQVMRSGIEKYTAYNWTDHPMRASTYFDAIMRHLWEWWAGRDFDPETNINPHAHIRACSGIMLDQIASGRMIDDRPKNLAKLEPVFADLEVLIARSCEEANVQEPMTAAELKERHEEARKEGRPYQEFGEEEVDLYKSDPDWDKVHAAEDAKKRPPNPLYDFPALKARVLTEEEVLEVLQEVTPAAPFVDPSSDPDWDKSDPDWDKIDPRPGDNI
ncbi:MAG: dATP/dGTP diphosphohydrolase domain-containing protein [Acidiferrobacterales bacterium]